MSRALRYVMFGIIAVSASVVIVLIGYAVCANYLDYCRH